MPKRFQQTGPRTWPGGDSVYLLQLAMEPDEIAARLGIRFRADEEPGLGPFVDAAIEVEGGRLMLFLRHEHAPVPGTSVLIDRDDELEAAAADVEQMLGIPCTPDSSVPR